MIITIQYLFMIKALKKLGIQGPYNITKAIYDKCLASNMLNEEKPKAFPLKSGMRRVSTVPTLFQYGA
jgi:hypothetical protein